MRVIKNLAHGISKLLGSAPFCCLYFGSLQRVLMFMLCKLSPAEAQVQKNNGRDQLE